MALPQTTKNYRTITTGDTSDMNQTQSQRLIGRGKENGVLTPNASVLIEP